jgi:hypothetical protein
MGERNQECIQWWTAVFLALTSQFLLQRCQLLKLVQKWISPLTQELNPSAQRCLTRLFSS